MQARLVEMVGPAEMLPQRLSLLSSHVSPCSCLSHSLLLFLSLSLFLSRTHFLSGLHSLPYASVVAHDRHCRCGIDTDVFKPRCMSTGTEEPAVSDRRQRNRQGAVFFLVNAGVASKLARGKSHPSLAILLSHTDTRGSG